MVSRRSSSRVALAALRRADPVQIEGEKASFPREFSPRGDSRPTCAVSNCPFGAVTPCVEKSGLLLKEDRATRNQKRETISWQSEKKSETLHSSRSPRATR